MRAVLIGLGLMSVICSQTAQAQFWERLGNPTVPLEVEHPPSVGMMVDHVVIGPVRGDCAEELVQILAGGLRMSGLAVTNRVGRHNRTSRYDRSFRDRVNRAASAEAGRVRGSAAMLALDVRRCETKSDFSEEQPKRRGNRDDRQQQGGAETVYQLEAKGRLDMTLLAIDLTSGRSLDERRLTYSSPKREFSSTRGYPQEPPPLDLLHEELDEAAEQVRRMFTPWVEEIGVTFFDDKDCELRQSYRALRRGDYRQALALSEQNLAACERTPGVERKLLARAHYNVGIAHLMRHDYDAALTALHEAQQVRSSGIIREGIATARKAQASADLMARFQGQTRYGRTHPSDRYGRTHPSDRFGGARPGDFETLRNADVMRMVDEGLPASLIVRKINSSRTDFETSTPTIIALVRQGVDEDIIKAMLTAD